MSKHDPIEPQDGSRSNSRTELALSATIVRSGKQMRVVLRDVSAGGAAATTPFPPGPKEQVRLSSQGVAIGCRVVWARGKSFGLVFDQPLTPSQLSALTTQE